MKAFYKAIEDKIKAAGYLGAVSGEAIYDEICDEIEEKESGSYLFMCKQTDDIYFEYKIDIHENDFNLSYLVIHTPDQDFDVDFDA